MLKLLDKQTFFCQKLSCLSLLSTQTELWPPVIFPAKLVERDKLCDKEFITKNCVSERCSLILLGSRFN